MSQNYDKKEEIESLYVSKKSETPNNANIKMKASSNFDLEGSERFNNPNLPNKNSSIKKEDQVGENNNLNENVKNEKDEEGNIIKVKYNNPNNEQNCNNRENNNLFSKNNENINQYLSGNNSYNNGFNNQNNNHNNDFNSQNNNYDYYFNKNNPQESTSSKKEINISEAQKKNYNNNSHNNNEKLNSNNYNVLNNSNNNINNNNINFNNKNTFRSNSSKKNEEIDITYFKDLKIFFSLYRKDPRTALVEYNNNSYLNAVLQLIGHIPNFAFYFLNPEQQNNINNNIRKMPLTFVTERLFTHLYPFPEKAECEIYNTNTYLRVLSEINMVYNTDKTQRNNPNELISFILDILDKEINNGKINSSKIYNKFNYEEAIKAGYQNIMKNIISDNLNWYQLNEAKCQNCHNSMYKVISYNTFNLDIGKCFNKIQNGNVISLSHCLNIYNEPIYQRLRCDKCNDSFQLISTMKKIFSAPTTFIFLLDRGINFDNSNKVLQIPFLIDKEIDLSSFILNPKSPNYYKLTGIVSIFLKEQKYTSFCLSPIEKTSWYYYNDEKVEYTDINIILKQHQNKEYIPCILMYSAFNKNNN